MQGGPVVKTLLPKQGAWVRFLVGELRFPMAGQKKKKKYCGEEVLKHSVLVLLLEESPLKRQCSTSSPTPVIKMGFLHPRGYIPGAESQLPNYSLKGLFFSWATFQRTSRKCWKLLLYNLLDEARCDLLLTQRLRFLWKSC